MLIVLIIFNILMLIASFVIPIKLEDKNAKSPFDYDDNLEFYAVPGALGGIFGVFALIGAIICLGVIINSHQLDARIALYEETNKSIEVKIQNSVTDYMGYEKDIFDNLDINAIVLKYPELKSNELVQEEITLYQENNKKIVELKEAKIDANVARWWLYFGGE